jgi:hypothetical protein
MELRFCDEQPFGFSWVVADERVTRTSHALVANGRVWLVDPVDWEPALERAGSAGAPAGVVQLLSRHNRDCAAIAARLGVPHHLVPESISEAPFAIVPVRRAAGWREVALWWPETRTLVVAEAIGTNSFFAPTGPAGVHLLLRPTPPRAQLGEFRPEHLLVGHGEGLHGAAATAGLRFALDHARTGLPRALLQLPAFALDAFRRRR